MDITFWGTRGSIPVPGRDTSFYGGNTACVELAVSSGKRLIIDSGTGIRALGERILSEPFPAEVYLLITHIHWDHIMGFPFFKPISSPDARITVDGFPSCVRGVKHIFDNNMGDGFFPVAFRDLEADIRFPERLKDGPLEVGEAVVDPVRLAHPQGGYGFRITEAGRSVVFITDNELGADFSAMDRCARFCEGAELLIHDAQYLPGELPERKGWGHSSYVEAVDLAALAGVERLVLYHHDPARTDEQVQSIETSCREYAAERCGGLEVSAAREGSTISI